MQDSIINGVIELANSQYDHNSSERALNLIKALFDMSTNCIERQFGPFRELMVEGFEYDAETIWEEIQTKNKPLTRYLKRTAKSLYVRKCHLNTKQDDLGPLKVITSNLSNMPRNFKAINTLDASIENSKQLFDIDKSSEDDSIVENASEDYGSSEEEGFYNLDTSTEEFDAESDEIDDVANDVEDQYHLRRLENYNLQFRYRFEILRTNSFIGRSL